MNPLYIFDLDGTLARTDHRQHILRDENDPHRWRKFFAACVDDAPNMPVIRTMSLLFRSHADIMIFSGRSDEVRNETVAWLVKYTDFSSGFFLEGLKMRRRGDHTPDEDLKRKWYQEMHDHDRSRLMAVFDDRDKVVSMWRSIGVPCFQVAPGGF